MPVPTNTNWTVINKGTSAANQREIGISGNINQHNTKNRSCADMDQLATGFTVDPTALGNIVHEAKEEDGNGKVRTVAM
jgi:hypothetical protein